MKIQRKAFYPEDYDCSWLALLRAVNDIVEQDSLINIEEKHNINGLQELIVYYWSEDNAA